MGAEVQIQNITTDPGSEIKLPIQRAVIGVTPITLPVAHVLILIGEIHRAVKDRQGTVHLAEVHLTTVVCLADLAADHLVDRVDQREVETINYQ